ncbi:MAG: class I SAM-dependent methyltransferase [Bacteroidales bacterium]|jgi:SAM-dependent methyltransferase|nr:class I SAM-dependent methyltransferase [Bacteroidales bacterium]
MQYEPIKGKLGVLIKGNVFLRKTLYFFLDLLLLRTWHVKKALRTIGAMLPADAHMLDAGSGFGQYSWWVIRKNPGWFIRAVDINNDHIRDCEEFFGKTGRGGRIKCETADLTTLKEENSYELILSVDVMEHIADDEAVFRNFNSALREGGFLVISTPSDQGGSDVHSGDDHSFIDEHVRDGYGTGEIREKLERSGFTDVETRYTYGIPGRISWILSMKYPVSLLNISYLFFIFLPFYYLLAFPLSFILNFCDLYLKHKTGTGLLVTARKRRQ